MPRGLRDPLVSIVLPTFNREAWLPDAVASVQAQTWTHWELFVVDDGSTDGSVSRLPSDPRNHVIRRPHTGHLALVRQAGLLASTGVYVGFLDSDDRWHAEKLASQVAALDGREDRGWCHGPAEIIDTEGARVRGAPFWRPREHDVARAMIEGEAGIALQSVLVRRTLAVGLGFDPRLPFGEDYDFLLRLALAAPACAVGFPVAQIREHPGRTTAERYDHHLGLAMAFWKGRRLTADAALRRRCRQRALRALRAYLAHGRARGRLAADALATLAAFRRL